MTIDAELRAAATAYREGGAGDVPAENEAAWQRWALWPRPLAGVAAPTLATTVAGMELDAPVLVAASAGHALWHAEGEVETARGARDAGVVLSLSQGSSAAPADVARVSGPYLQQVYLPRRRELVRPFVDRVVALGSRALVLTVDQPGLSWQQPFRRALIGSYQRPPWEPYDLTADGAEPAPSFTVDDVAWLADLSPVPVLVKGVLHPDDAVAAVDAGATGVVVSNHGGRQLDGSVTPAEVLPEVADAVGHRASVLVDSGIRSAADVFRALCLGADAAFVGRPVLRALEAGGGPAVTALLRDLVDELGAVLALTGAESVADCHPGRLRARAVAG